MLTASAIIPAASAQTIAYTTTGTLTVISGADQLGLGGTTFTVTNSLNVGQAPLASTQNQYATTITASDSNGLSQTVPAVITLDYAGPNDPSNSISLTATITVLVLNINVASTISVPSITSESPGAIATTPLGAGDTITLSSGANQTVYGFSSGTISSVPSLGCVYTVAPSSLQFPYGGGSNGLTITGSPANAPSCTWTASASEPFIQLNTNGGTGSGTLEVTVPPNSTNNELSGQITVAGQIVPVIQEGPVQCIFTVSPSSLSFPSVGGTTAVNVTATPPSCTWTAVANQTFLSVDTPSGTGNGTVNVTAAANTGGPLTGSVTIAGFTIPVSEAAPLVCAFSVTPYVSFPSAGGSSVLTVAASDPSCTWSASSNQTFATLGASSGTGNGTITVTVPPDANTTALTATLTVAGQAIPLVEAGTANLCTFSVAPTTLMFPSSASSMNVAVAASSPSCVWNVSNIPGWLTPSAQSVTGSGVVTFSAALYEGTTNLTGDLTVAGVTLPVTQISGGTCSYTIAPLRLDFGSSGGTAILTLTAPANTCTYTAASNNAWISVTPNSGTGNGTLSVAVAANPSTVFLYGSIAVAGQIIPISEAGLTGCAYFVTPGSLTFPGTGGIANLSLTSTYPDCVWTAVSNVPWVTLSPATGTGNATIQAVAAFNTTTGSLAGTATIGGQNIGLTESAGVPCSFAVSSNALLFPTSGGGLNVTVVANAPSCTWTATSNSPLVTVTPASGTGSSPVTVSLGSNTSGAPLNATVVLAGATVQVNQQGGCTLAVAPAVLGADVNGGVQTLTVTGSASCTWSAYSNVPWATVSPLSGTGPATVSVTFAPNTTGADLTGTVAIAGQTVALDQGFTIQAFSDVPPTSYYFDAVNIMAAEGVTTGCAPGLFCPGATLTRAQMAVFIVRGLIGNDNFSYSTIPYFADVPAGSFGFQWIQKLFELGITTGCGNGDFCPTMVVTRDQMAVFLVRGRLGASTVFTYPGAPYFTDVPSSYWAFSWIQRFAQDHITTGCGPSLYCPTGVVTRGDASIFILRSLQNLLLPAGTPVISQVNPRLLAQGQTETISVSGANTNFVQGMTTISPIPGVTVDSVTVNTATFLSVTLTAAGDANPEPYPVLVITGSEQAVSPSGITIQ